MVPVQRLEPDNGGFQVANFEDNMRASREKTQQSIEPASSINLRLRQAIPKIELPLVTFGHVLSFRHSEPGSLDVRE